MKGKKAIVAALAVAAASCFLGIGAIGVGAEELPVTESYFGFETGASVRKEEPAGLRFIVNYGEEINALVTDEEAALNVYIAPAEYFEKAAGDLDAVAARAVKAEIDKQTIYTKDDALYAANAVLGNVRYENINREFQAVAAIEKAGAETVYSEVSDARSIAYVASAAQAKGETEAVLDTFVQKGIAAASGVAEDEFVDGSYEIELTLDESLVLEEDGEAALTLGITPAVDLYAEWASDNEEVAVVDENGKVTAVAEGTANITATVYGESVTCKVTVENLKNFGYFDFSEYEVGATEIDGFKAEVGATAQNSYSVVDDAGEKVLKFEHTTQAQNQWVNMIFDLAVIGDFSGFDFVDMEMKIVAEGNGGGASLGPGYSHPNGITDGQVLNSAKNQWETYTWSLDTLKSGTDMTIAEDMKTVGRLLFTMNPWAAQKVTVYLKNIVGYYADIETDGETAIDLTEQFNLSASEFTAVYTPTGGTEIPVADVTSFKPEQTTGTLRLTVNKTGYAEKTFNVSVNEKAAPGTILNLNAYNVGDSYPVSGGTAEVIYDEISGKKALKITNNSETVPSSGSPAVLTFSGDVVKQIANYDKFVIKARIYYEGVSANVNLQVSNVSGRPSWGDFAASNGGDGTAHEWVFDKTVNQWTFTQETNSFTIKFVKWNAAPQITIVTDIYAYNQAE